MRTRVFYPDWRTWLDASLLPFKIYTVLAVVWILGWRACVSRNDWAMDDSYTVAYFVALGYILSATALMAGAITQGTIRSWRAGSWSVSFAGAALVIGICMLQHFNLDGCFQIPGTEPVLGIN
jgi:hypothetical protein